MPQSSYPYANGYIFSISQRMLGSARLARLTEADSNTAVKLLREMGYGVSAADPNDVESMINAELEEARKVVFEITPQPEVIELFLLDADAHNLKTLLKAKLLGIDADEMLIGGGLLPMEKLKRAVNDAEPEVLPGPFSGAVKNALAIIARDPDPRLISAEVDRAVFQFIDETLKNHKNAFAGKYFSAKADYINVKSLIRARALNWEAAELAPMLVSAGEISPATILSALELPAEQLAKKLNIGAQGGEISRCMEEYALSGDASSMDERMDSALMKMVKDGKMDMFGMGPIVGYLLGRQAEASALRVIFAAKQAGVEPKLPEQYM